MAISGVARSEALGKIGPTYPIAEQNLLEHITAKLKEKERSGELAKLQQQARARATATVTNPPAVPGLKAAETARTFYFDPSVQLPQNVLDERGRVLFAAGTVKNPLDVISMSKHLLFFDGRDARQVKRARELIDLYRGRVKPILVGGSYLNLMKSWQIPVYYDQQGLLVRKLGITAVPAIVSQEGKRLRVDELALQ
ncbi:MAG: type-F conjugative transfer system protein TraW [Rhodocyclales bacterium]|nr:type-F conjugative transfer system protein TraW [Rhodocyclales bacterium]